jgi:hypothetical protein
MRDENGRDAEIQPHPLADCLPAMTGEEYAELLRSIRDHGLKVRIKLYENRVLDGRHRLRVLRDLGVETGPEHFEKFQGTADQAAVMVEVWNLHRRHLTPEQQRAARQHLACRLRDQGMSVRAIASELGVPKSTVARDIEAQVSHGGTPGMVGSDHQVSHRGTPEPTDAGCPAAPAEAPALKVVGRDGKSYDAARPGRAKKRADPPADGPPPAGRLARLAKLMTALASEFTSAVRDDCEESRRLKHLLSVCGLLDHRKGGAKFVPLLGVRRLVETAGGPGPLPEDAAVRHRYDLDSGGFVPPVHVRLRGIKKAKRRAGQRSSGEAG